MPLSKADVAEALVVVKRFAPHYVVDEIAVESWHALLEPVVPDAGVLRDAILTVFRDGDLRDLPSRIVAEARNLTGWEPPSPHENVTARVAEQQLQRALEEAGIPRAQFDDSVARRDVAWLREHLPSLFPDDRPGALEQ